MRDAGRHHLAAARPAGHEMRLDQAGGDAQVGLDEAAVELHRRAARRACAPRSTCAASLRAKWFSTRTSASTQGSPTSSASSAPRLGRCRPVATSTVMRVERDAGRHHGLDHRPQEQPVRHRAGDVADQDAGAAPAAGEGAQAGRSDRVRRGHARWRRAGRAASGSAPLRITVARAPGGSVTGRVPLPKRRSTLSSAMPEPLRPAPGTLCPIRPGGQRRAGGWGQSATGQEFILMIWAGEVVSGPRAVCSRSCFVHERPRRKKSCPPSPTLPFRPISPA